MQLRVPALKSMQLHGAEGSLKTPAFKFFQLTSAQLRVPAILIKNDYLLLDSKIVNNR